MEVGDEKRINGNLWVWVKCPDCALERWIKKYSVQHPSYTGLCKRCYMKIAGYAWRL